MNPLRRWRRSDIMNRKPDTTHVRIVWFSKCGQGGSFLVLRCEAANYIHQLRTRFGRLASLKVNPE
mgnify:CR=1 FL=1